jgi:hypothetical protein
MGILKYLYRKESIKRKILEIEDGMKTRVASVCPEPFWIWWFGAFRLSHKNLAYWICVKTDATKLTLKSDSLLQKDLRELLAVNNYPEEARLSVFIDFESQETVDRESQGNWYAHLK